MRRFSVSMDPDLVEWVDQYAEATNRNRSQVIALAVQQIRDGEAHDSKGSINIESGLPGGDRWAMIQAAFFRLRDEADPNLVALFEALIEELAIQDRRLTGIEMQVVRLDMRDGRF